MDIEGLGCVKIHFPCLRRELARSQTIPAYGWDHDGQSL